MNTPVIVSATRTAIGAFGGSLKNISAPALGSKVIQEVVAQARLQPAQIDQVIMGNVIQAGLGQNPARQAALGAGLPVEVNALTINKVCGSGLEAVLLAAERIRCGDAEIVVAGGMENMSRAPYLLMDARYGYRLGDNKLVDSMVHDGLWDVYNNVHMGKLTETLARQNGISRADQDQFAAESQKKYATALAAGRFKEEIVPIEIPQHKAPSVVFNQDEFPKSDTTVERLSKLKPAFEENGTITAGTASGINDGAAAVVIMSADKATQLGLKPMASLVAHGSAGVDPALMGIGPVPAVEKALRRAGLALSDIDLIELNEAFAAQSIAVCRSLGFAMERVNVNGGSIAIGHPIGASGARILVTLLYELRRRQAQYGLATLCIGGGEGVALIVKTT